MRAIMLKLGALIWGLVMSAGLSYGADSTEATFLTRYDFSVREGAVTSSFKSQAFFAGARKITFGYTPHVVDLSLEHVSDSEYDLRMTVSGTQDTPRQVRLNKTFRGRYGIPLDLAANEGEVRVNGTLAILRSK